MECFPRFFPTRVLFTRIVLHGTHFGKTLIEVAQERSREGGRVKFKDRHHYLLAERSQASFLTSLILSLLTYKMGTVTGL